MKELTPLLRFFKTAYANRVKTLCDPLKQTFGIDTFWHSTIGSKGEFTHISNTPEGTCHYFENHYYLNNPFLRHPENYSKGFYFPGDMPEPTYSESQKKHNAEFGIDHLLFFCKPEKELCHIFGFATSQKNLPMLTIYLNNTHLLKQFAEHFLSEVTHFPFDSFQVELPKLVGPSFFWINKFTPGLNVNKKSNFLKTLGYPDLSALSSREKECLELFLQGKTAQQTALLLNLSRRTVETYFENIKDKLGCLSKAEILQSLKKLTP